MKKVLLALALQLQAAAAPPDGTGCDLLLTTNGSMITIEAVVHTSQWPAGSYTLLLEAHQSGSRSVSRQGGAINAAAQGADGTLVLASSTVYIVEGGRLIARLDLLDGAQRASCMIEHAP
jgi:hypothetical protein